MNSAERKVLVEKIRRMPNHPIETGSMILFLERFGSTEDKVRWSKELQCDQKDQNSVMKILKCQAQRLWKAFKKSSSKN